MHVFGHKITWNGTMRFLVLWQILFVLNGTMRLCTLLYGSYMCLVTKYLKRDHTFSSLWQILFCFGQVNKSCAVTIGYLKRDHTVLVLWYHFLCLGQVSTSGQCLQRGEVLYPGSSTQNGRADPHLYQVQMQQSQPPTYNGLQQISQGSTGTRVPE